VGCPGPLGGVKERAFHAPFIFRVAGISRRIFDGSVKSPISDESVQSSNPAKAGLRSRVHRRTPQRSPCSGPAQRSPATAGLNYQERRLEYLYFMLVIKCPGTPVPIGVPTASAPAASGGWRLVRRPDGEGLFERLRACRRSPVRRRASPEPAPAARQARFSAPWPRRPPTGSWARVPLGAGRRAKRQPGQQAFQPSGCRHCMVTIEKGT
jgi:hypothetical protein